MPGGRPPLPVGSYGKIAVLHVGPSQYKARARYRDSDGTTRSMARFGQTKGEAERRLRAALASREHDDGDVLATSTVRDLADIWMASPQVNGLASNTREVYGNVVANHVKPLVGALRLAELTPARVSRALAIVRDTAGPGAAKTTKSVLSGMCRLAVMHDAIRANPVRETIRLPSRPREAIRALTRDEADDLCDRLRADERSVLLDLPDLVEWMLGTGCRIGEALAARSTVIDRASGTWEINATLIRVTGEGLRIQNRPKTAAGWRVLALPPYTLALLERRDDELRIHGPQAVVFGSPYARSLRDPSNTAGDLREVLDRLGYPWVHSHTFRKTVATRLDEAGLSAREIADQLGHRRPSITLDTYMGRAVVSARAAQALER